MDKFKNSCLKNLSGELMLHSKNLRIDQIWMSKHLGLDCFLKNHSPKGGAPFQVIKKYSNEDLNQII